jgi:hypothetical protein
MVGGRVTKEPQAPSITPRSLHAEAMEHCLELTDMVYASGSLEEGGTYDREGARSRGGGPSGDHPTRLGGDRQRLADVPVLRDHAPSRPQVAPAVRRAWLGGSQGPLTDTHMIPNATKPEVKLATVSRDLKLASVDSNRSPNLVTPW